MPNLRELENAMPVAPLKLVALSSAERMGQRVNDYLVEFRKSVHNDKVKKDPAFHGYSEDNYLVEVHTPRFGSGEGKANFSESIRGKDLFILVDVCNHSITYQMNGYTNHMSPDDHYQDLKRVIAACNGKAHRINVINNIRFGRLPVWKYGCGVKRIILKVRKREEADVKASAFGGENLCYVRQIRQPGGICGFGMPERKNRSYKSFRRSPAIIQNVVAQPLSSLIC